MSAMSEKVIVVGLGNPILSDDGIGWCVAATVRDRVQAVDKLSTTVDVQMVAVGGLSLAEMLVGYSRAIIIDAIMTTNGVPGTVYELTLADLPGTLNMASAHDTNLSTALHTLRRYGAGVPRDDAISVIAVEASDVWTFAERCTPAVEASVPGAIGCVMSYL